MTRLFFILVFFGGLVHAEPSPEKTWKLFEAGLPGKECVARAKEFSEFRLLFALPEFADFLTTPSTLSTKLSPVIRGWSTDLVVKIVMQLDQELRPACKPFPKSLDKLINELQAVYLEKIGVARGKDTDNRFRAFISLKEDAVRIQQLFATLKPKADLPTEKLVSLAFGNSVKLRGVWILSPHPVAIKKWEAALEGVCPRPVDCVFWDSRVLYKVTVATEPGIAAFIPEVSALVMSSSLVEEANLLHKVIFLHELAHVAERRAWLRERKAWLEEYREFSGWKKSDSGEWSAQVEKSDKERNDELTKLSANSPFSILPDPVYLPKTVGGTTYDGFVMAKGYEQSIRENDPAEDFADHVALYRLYPARYCFEGNPIAPRKAAWIHKMLWPKASVPTCTPKRGAQ